MKKNVDLPACEEVIATFKTNYKQLTNEQLNQLFFNNTSKVFTKGEDIYHQGRRVNGCYFVYSGIVKLYQTGGEGKEQILRFARKGDLISFRSVINQELACTSAKAVNDAVLYFIPSSVLISFLKTNPEFAYRMIQLVCKELGESNCYITDIAQKSVKERLAEVLTMLISDFGLDDDNILQITITREELANMVGTATESVIRLLSEFKTEMIIETKGRKIRILNPSKLSIIAKSY